MPTRTATTTWSGDLQSGSGNVELSSSKIGSYEVSFPKRAADEAGGSNARFSVRSDVTLSPDPAGGFRIRSSKLTVRGSVDGIDNDAFVKAAEEAKAGCPVSKLFAGNTEITLDAALG